MDSHSGDEFENASRIIKRCLKKGSTVEANSHLSSNIEKLEAQVAQLISICVAKDTKFEEISQRHESLVASCRNQANTIGQLKAEEARLRESLEAAEKKALRELNKFLKMEFEKDKLSGNLEDKAQALEAQEIEHTKLKSENQKLAAEGYKMVTRIKELEDSRTQMKKLLTDV